MPKRKKREVFGLNIPRRRITKSKKLPKVKRLTKEQVGETLRKRIARREMK